MIPVVFVITLVISSGVCDISAYYPKASSSLDYDANPQYTFSYSVNDAFTGDNHAQEETRQGDNVHGSYSLVDADGSLRTVKYSADPLNGFTAIVERSGHGTKVFGGAAPAAIAPIVPAPSVNYVAPAVSYLAPKAPIVRHNVYRPGGATVHTSFSAPHTSYHY